MSDRSWDEEGRPLVRDRDEYRLNLSERSWSDGDLDARWITAEDTTCLATLMLAAYRDTVDYDGEGPEESLSAVQGFFEGAWGTPILRASGLVEEDGELLSACLVTLYRDAPLIAIVMTHPGKKRRGLGKRLLGRCLQALKELGHEEVVAIITRGNRPSEELFRKIGFRGGIDGVAGDVS